MSDAPSSGMPDMFDRILGNLTGLPDVTHVKETTIRTMTPLLGTADLFIVQTFRQKEQGDTIFLERINKEGTVRLVLPAQVCDAIARQRDSLTTKTRSKAAKAAAADRKARGILPGFMKNRNKGRKPAKKKAKE